LCVEKAYVKNCPEVGIGRDFTCGSLRIEIGRDLICGSK
jgi:hypothetical protein